MSAPMGTSDTINFRCCQILRKKDYLMTSGNVLIILSLNVRILILRFIEVLPLIFLQMEIMT